MSWMKVFKYLNQYNKKIKSQKTIYLKSHMPVGGATTLVGLFRALDTKKQTKQSLTSQDVWDVSWCEKGQLFSHRD